MNPRLERLLAWLEGVRAKFYLNAYLTDPFGAAERAMLFALKAQGRVLERLRKAGVFRPGQADAWAQDPYEDDKPGDGGDS